MKPCQYLATAAAATLVGVAAGAASAGAAPAPVDRPGLAVAAADPAKTVGKLFFTANGKQHECTGNVVESGNRDTISTAGSCLYFRENDGDQGVYVSEASFVPGYNKGDRPYGTWTVRAMAVTTSWLEAPPGIATNDAGFAVLNTLNGQHVQDVVGGSPTQFNRPVGSSNVLVVGYEAGETATTNCNGNIEASFYPPVSCGLGDGGQGAPWFVDGVQMNNTLHHENGNVTGAAWQDEVKGALEYAQSR
jgi:hypothetical protein